LNPELSIRLFSAKAAIVKDVRDSMLMPNYPAAKKFRYTENRYQRLPKITFHEKDRFLTTAINSPPLVLLIFFDEFCNGFFQEGANGFILVNRKMFQGFKSLGINSGRKCFFGAHASIIIIFISLFQVFFL